MWGDNSQHPQAGIRSSTGKKAAETPCNISDRERTKLADMPGCGELEAMGKASPEKTEAILDAVGCMGKTGTETAFSSNFGKKAIGMDVESVDNVDKCIGNQNSGQYTQFSQGTAMPEKENSCLDRYSAQERAAWMTEPPVSGSAGRKAGNGSGKDAVFADRTVETMVREMSWKEEMGAACNIPEQAPDIDCRILEQGARECAVHEFAAWENTDFEKWDPKIVDAKEPEKCNAYPNILKNVLIVVELMI